MKIQLSPGLPKGNILCTLIRNSTHRCAAESKRICSLFLQNIYVHFLHCDSGVISSYMLLYPNKLRAQTHKLQKYILLLHRKSCIKQTCEEFCLFICFTMYYTHVYTCLNIYIYIYTGCHRRNGPNFGRVFLMLNYTDIIQNTYIQS